MSNPTCPECKGTGVYQGLNTVEPCRACGGFKPSQIEDAREAFNKEWDEIYPTTIHIKVTDRCIMSVHCETREIEFFGQITRRELVCRTISLSSVFYSRDEVDSIREAYLSKKPVNVSCTFLDNVVGLIIATISGWHVTYSTMEGSIELIERRDDA